MEAFAICEQTSPMSTQDFALRLQKTIDHVHMIERLLDGKVRKEMEALLTEHAHIQNELNG